MANFIEKWPEADICGRRLDDSDTYSDHSGVDS